MVSSTPIMQKKVNNFSHIRYWRMNELAVDFQNFSRGVSAFSNYLVLKLEKKTKFIGTITMKRERIQLKFF